MLPAIGFFTRAGRASPYVPGHVYPSVQFDCWAGSPIGARSVYRALYSALQGIQDVNVGPVVVVGSNGLDYRCILAHTSTAADKPITGVNWATYWVATGSSGLGSIWASGTLYPITYKILSAEEEVQGQDLVDTEMIPNYFRVLTFFAIGIKVE